LTIVGTEVQDNDPMSPNLYSSPRVEVKNYLCGAWPQWPSKVQMYSWTSEQLRVTFGKRTTNLICSFLCPNTFWIYYSLYTEV